MDASKADKASSSSAPSSSSKRWEYQVFLSFRGADTRGGFTGHLHAALSDAGISVFFDDDNLKKAKTIKTELEQAIEGSMMSIIVFSEGYADSTWCLDELVKIMECRERLGQLVIPLFYNVDASDVRRQRGSFALAFERHEGYRELERQKVWRWRNALSEAAGLCGEDLRNAHGHEAQFIKKIVKEVNRQLYSKYQLDIEHLAGITSQMKVLIDHLDIEKSVELDQADLSAAEQEQANQVLALPSAERAANRLIASEGLISSAWMRSSRNDPNMQARLMKMAKKGPSGGSAGSSQSARVEASPHMSLARSQATSAAATPAQGAQKRKTEEQLLQDMGKRRVEKEPRRDSGKRQVSSSAPEAGKRTSVDPASGPLEPWVDGEVVLSSYHEAIKRVLKVEVVEGLFTEEMGYRGMTLSALEDHMKAIMKLFIATHNIVAHQEFDRCKKDEHAVTLAELSRTIGEKVKVEEELELMRGWIEAEMKKNAELLSSVNKHAEDKRGLGIELSTSQKNLDEANRKIEAFASKLRSCYDDAVNDYIESAEYQEKLASQRVEGYFDLIEKVGEKYPSLDWSFLDEDAKDDPAEQDGGPNAEPVSQGSDQVAQIEDPSIQSGEATAREGDLTAQGGEPTVQGGEPIGEVVVIKDENIG